MNQGDIKNINDKYSELQFIREKNIFSGKIEVHKGDKYQIEIEINRFPKNFPIVKEIGDRIPKKADRHIYSNGTCCLTTPAMESFLLKRNIKTVFDFIEQIVIPYFQNNSFFESNGFYKNGEYTHYLSGKIESYFDILHTNNLQVTLDLLIKRLKREKLKINELCFCGSGKALKKCHLKYFNDLFLIDEEIIKHDLNELFEFVKKVEAEKLLIE